MTAHSSSFWIDRPRHIQAKIRDVEQELDLTWPDWRLKKPFGHLDYDRLARVKYLLKRHALLTHEEAGVPSPRDWEVIVVRDKSNPSQCYAHPVSPDRPVTGDAGEPPAVIVPERPALSATSIALTHRLALEHVETAIRLVPQADEADVIRIARHLAGGAA